MQVRSYAKINWSLRVTGKRADGFHDLETVFQAISLHDTLTFTPAEGLTLTCDDPAIPTDETNLVVRAARALALRCPSPEFATARQRTTDNEPRTTTDGAPPVAIHLEKRIPAGGGLGGGSSNAATTLVTLARMFSLDAPLAELALSLGSDVPFFLAGGTAYATGRGEVLTALPPAAGIPLLLLMPEERVLTKDAFAGLRRFSAPIGIERASRLLPEDLVNDFEESVFAMLPRLAALKQRLLDAGAAWAGMSGSGSTIVGRFTSAAAREAARAAFGDVRAVACETI
jgi:4-diphosphocytidyl-2-C-methyl-D-erythritol kinase